MSESRSSRGWWLWTLNPLALLLWPVSMVFCGLVVIRRQLFKRGWFKSQRLPVPVIVVGNVSVGGSGKTPVVIETIRLLQRNGYTPGILTRGYKSDHEGQVRILTEGGTSTDAGDEANMLSEICRCPIAIGADRARSGAELLQANQQLDCLVCDDGLQHYALARDLEIIVKRDAALGNRLCLPAGPLREPLSRLNDAQVMIDRDQSELYSRPLSCWNLYARDQQRSLDSFTGQPLHALAGIAFPEPFFAELRQNRLDITGHAFVDHHDYRIGDLQHLFDKPWMVTHKDAVKLGPLLEHEVKRPEIWVVPLELRLPDELQYRVIQHIESISHG